jgi:hypothetical protein
MEVSFQVDGPAALHPGEAAYSTYCTEGWADVIADLGYIEKRKISCCCKESNPISSVIYPEDQSLYPLRYPGSF